MDNKLINKFNTLSKTGSDVNRNQEKNEPILSQLIVPYNWPARGFVKFDKVSLSYDINESPAVIKASFTISPREKVKKNILSLQN